MEGVIFIFTDVLRQAFNTHTVSAVIGDLKVLVLLR
jgi:hypothetical protein